MFKDFNIALLENNVQKLILFWILWVSYSDTNNIRARPEINLKFVMFLYI